MRRLMVGMAVAVTTLAAGSGPSWAAGGSSISGAPAVQYGVLESGGGMLQEFWHLPTYAGDRVTLDWNQSDGDSSHDVVNFYSPSTNDYSVGQANPFQHFWQYTGKSQIVLHSPYTGQVVMQVTGGYYDIANAYTFVASVQHAVSVTLSAPSVVLNPRSWVNVVAHVQSPAGAPTGFCRFQRLTGRVTTLVTDEVLHGLCRAHFRAGAQPFKVRVLYLSNPGWRSDSATSRKITVLNK